MKISGFEKRKEMSESSIDKIVPSRARKSVSNRKRKGGIEEVGLDQWVGSRLRDAGSEY